jgi:hypothetical protein
MKGKQLISLLLSGLIVVGTVIQNFTGTIESKAESTFETDSSSDISEDGMIKTGMCGENISYSWNTESGAVYITGSGDMYDYINGGTLTSDENESTVYSPFLSSDIKSVIIEEGITDVGEGMFAKCPKLTNVELPETILEIKNEAFLECTALETILLMSSQRQE